LLLLISLST